MIKLGAQSINSIYYRLSLIVHQSSSLVGHMILQLWDESERCVCEYRNATDWCQFCLPSVSSFESFVDRVTTTTTVRSVHSEHFYLNKYCLRQKGKQQTQESNETHETVKLFCILPIAVGRNNVKVILLGWVLFVFRLNWSKLQMGNYVSCVCMWRLYEAVQMKICKCFMHAILFWSFTAFKWPCMSDDPILNTNFTSNRSRNVRNAQLFIWRQIFCILNCTTLYVRTRVMKSVEIFASHKSVNNYLMLSTLSCGCLLSHTNRHQP